LGVITISRGGNAAPVEERNVEQDEERVDSLQLRETKKIS